MSLGLQRNKRDNLEFQTIHCVEDLIAEVINKDISGFGKLKAKFNTFKSTGKIDEDIRKIKELFNSIILSKSVRSFIANSTISRLQSQINPLELMDNNAIVTRMGEGAIGSIEAVPGESRSVHYSHMGWLDPIATPESSKTGIDSRATINAIKGSDNEIYKKVLNLRTNKLEARRVIEMYDKYVGIPDSLHMKGKEQPTDMVPAIYKDKLLRIERSKLDFIIPSPHELHTVTTNTIPLANANQANRLLMGAKHLTQALPLKNGETRLVESNISSADAESTVKRIGDFLIPKAPVDGKVQKIDDDYIHIKSDDGSIYKVDYEHNLPLATKTMLINKPVVAVGDTVAKGDPLTESNFAKDGKLVMGRNLLAAFKPHEGLNHEDGIVLSESAAEKLTSVHAGRVSVKLDKDKIIDKSKFTSYFPTKFTKQQLVNIDDSGVIKKGSVVHQNDPIILVLGDNSNNRTNLMLGKLYKSLITRYKDESEVFGDEGTATVLEVQKAGRVITILLSSEHKAVIGDKLSASHGNKGVVTAILPDDHMPRNEEDVPVDVILTPMGITRRINPGQILESKLGKVAKKTGQPYSIENFSKEDYVDFVNGEMAKHGVKDKETLTDPVTGKKIPDISTGILHMHKLFKTTDKNFSARGIEGAYDVDEAPTGSGEAGPKALGSMEVNSLIAHNARNILKESALIRNSKNSDFWKQFQYGGIVHLPPEKKMFNKFTAILKQAGINVHREGDNLVAGPLTDKDILEMSSGEITEPTRLNAKLEPEPNGLFDANKTGGLNGTKWAHVKLHEPVMNPVFEDCIKSLLDLGSKDMMGIYTKDGGAALREKLNRINIPEAIKLTEKLINDTHTKGDRLDKLVKRLKYLKVLKERNLKPGDAYMLSNIPVTPPIIRPIIPGVSGDLMENDANPLYRDLILQNSDMAALVKMGLKEDVEKNRQAVYNRVKELVGIIAPENPQTRNKKGALAYIAGDQPKYGMFQRKMVYSKMNMTGRATIA